MALAARVLFVVGERRSKAPVFPVRLFADARFATANAVGSRPVAHPGRPLRRHRAQPRHGRAVQFRHPYWVLAIALSVANLGIGFTAPPPMTAALMEAAGPADAGIGSAVFNANRQIGTLVGVAAAGATLASASDWYDGARVTFSVAGIAYFLGLLLVAHFIRTSP